MVCISTDVLHTLAKSLHSSLPQLLACQTSTRKHVCKSINFFWNMIHIYFTSLHVVAMDTRKTIDHCWRSCGKLSCLSREGQPQSSIPSCKNIKWRRRDSSGMCVVWRSSGKNTIITTTRNRVESFSLRSLLIQTTVSLLWAAFFTAPSWWRSGLFFSCFHGYSFPLNRSLKSIWRIEK